jgi:hypothetical protein
MQDAGEIAMHVFTVCLSSTAIVLWACLPPLGGASAASQEVPFPTAGDAYYSARGGGAGTIPSGGQTAALSTAGDYVLSSVFSLPTTSVTGITVDWSFTDYLSGSDERWSVYVNGVQVASAVLPDCSGCGDTGTVSGTQDFAGIAPLNGGYQVELILRNTVPSGQGYVVWLDGGTTGLSYNSVPELPTWATMLLGFAGLGLLGYGKAKFQRPVASDT